MAENTFFFRNNSKGMNHLRNTVGAERTVLQVVIINTHKRKDGFVKVFL